VISEGTGYVAEGCNEWNESISAAIQDYEDHVVPILERDETFEIMIWTMERNWGHQHPVALIVGDLVDKESSFQLFHPQIIKTICQRMQKIGRECLIFDSGYSPEKEDEFIKRCIDLEVAGIFLLSATGTSLCLQNAAQRIPIVTINRHANTPFTDAILLDEYQCAYLAVQHLYELGHREICMVTEPKEIPLAYEMTRGYLDVCSQYKLWSAKKRIYQCNANYDDGFKLGREILECKLSHTLMESLQIIVTILVTNIIMLILQKADLFDVQYGLLISNIQAVFVQENEIYLEESNHLKQQIEREADEYMDELHEQIGKIEASLTDFSPFEGDACIELDRLNEIYQMGIDFKQEWLDFCQCNFVAGGN